MWQIPEANVDKYESEKLLGTVVRRTSSISDH